MNGIIYARYSSDSQREESIEGQIRECTEYAERSGITIINTYIDRALSAKTDNRPEFQRLVRDSAKRLFNVVIVWKLDRFARNRYDSAHYKAILRKNGAKVVSATERISEGADGILLESVLEGYAEYYSVELSEKIHRGQKENALKGRNNGGGIPLGYLLGDDQKLIVDPVTAPLVVEVFKRYAEGDTMRSIVEDFNRRGLKTRRNRPFNIGSFHALLRNRKYIGEYKYQDVVIPGGVPAIVPEELFERVQERVNKNKHAPAHAKGEQEYLLTTKLFCGDCEKMMVGESGKSHTGKVHYYYKCGGAKRQKSCKRKALKKDWIERIAVVCTVNRVLKDDVIDRIADRLLVMQEQEDPILPPLRRELQETKKGIDNLLNAIQQGILTSSTKERLESLEARKEELEISILQEQMKKPKLTKEQIVFWISQFKDGDINSIDYQRRIIDTFVNSIYVFDDYFIFGYNYKDSTERITLKDIEAVLGSDLIGSAPP